MAEEVTEVKPSVVDDEIRALPEADRWLSEAGSKAARIAADYKPHEIRDGDDYSSSRKARSLARSEIKELEDERKSLTKSIEDAVRDFKSRAKDALDPLTSIDADYKRYLDEWDAKMLDLKKEDILGAYEELAPGMVDLLPPERLWDTYAKQRKWVNKSTNVEAAKRDMAEVVGGISRDYSVIGSIECSSEDERDRLRADYFECLDLNQAIANHREREARVEAVKAHEQAQREWEEEQRRIRDDARQTFGDAVTVEESGNGYEENGTGAASDASRSDVTGPSVSIWEVRVPMDKQVEFRDAMVAIGGVHGRRLRVE